jgi:hypothetical protein
VHRWSMRRQPLRSAAAVQLKVHRIAQHCRAVLAGRRCCELCAD